MFSPPLHTSPVYNQTDRSLWLHTAGPCLQEQTARLVPSQTEEPGQLLHFLGDDGHTEDPILASALGADPAGVRACTALLWPRSNVPTVP